MNHAVTKARVKLKPKRNKKLFQIIQLRKYKHKQDLHGYYLATKFIKEWTSRP